MSGFRARTNEIIAETNVLIAEIKQWIEDEPDNYAAKMSLESLEDWRAELIAQLDGIDE